MADIIYDRSQKFFKYTQVLYNNQMQINRVLKIIENSQLIQEIPFKLLLAFPSLLLDTNSVDFGKVYLGCRKKMSVRLTNKTGALPTVDTK